MEISGQWNWKRQSQKLQDQYVNSTRNSRQNSAKVRNEPKAKQNEQSMGSHNETMPIPLDGGCRAAWGVLRPCIGGCRGPPKTRAVASLGPRLASVNPTSATRYISLRRFADLRLPLIFSMHTSHPRFITSMRLPHFLRGKPHWSGRLPTPWSFHLTTL